MSSEEWNARRDGDARIARMKEGRTHLAHKAEHGVELDTGARGGGDAARHGSGRRNHPGYDVRRGGDGGGVADWTGSGAAARR